MNFRVGEWKKIADPSREVCMNYPREVKPEEMLTEIYTPLE